MIDSYPFLNSNLNQKMAVLDSLFILPEELEYLLTDASVRVRRTAARHSTVSLDFLALLDRAASSDLNVTSQELELLSRLGPYAREIVAKHPNTPENILYKLFEEGYGKALAYNQKLPSDFLDFLFKDPKLYALLAQYQKINSSQFNILNGEKDIKIRANLARNPYISIFMLNILMQDEDWEVREAICESPILNSDLLTKLSKDRWNPSVREAVARYPHTSSVILDHLAEDPDEDVRLQVAYSANAHPYTLERLGKTNDKSVLVAIAANLNTPENILELLQANTFSAVKSVLELRYMRSENYLNLRMAQMRNHAMRLVVATRFITQSELLERLSLDRNSQIRAWVAAHPNTSDTVRFSLSGDASWEVRQVAQAYLHSPLPLTSTANTPYLTISSNIKIRYALASHPQALKARLEQLVDDPYPSVRRALASNPQSSLKMLINLGVDKHLHSLLLSHPLHGTTLSTQIEESERSEASREDTSSQRLYELSESSNESVRANVASNPVTSKEILLYLAQDTSVIVRRHLSCNAQAPDDVLLKLLDFANDIIIFSILKRLFVSSAILEKLSLRASVEVRRVLASRKDINDVIIKHMCKDTDKTTRLNLVQNVALSEILINILINSNMGYEYDMLIARHPNINSENLEFLLKRWNNRPRMMLQIISHNKINAKTLEYLARQYVEKLEKNSRGIRLWLKKWGFGGSEREYIEILRIVAKNPNSTFSLLNFLRKVRDPQLQSIISNRTLSMDGEKV